MQNFLGLIVFGNSVQDWLLALLAFLLIFIALPLLRSLIRRKASGYDRREMPAAAALFLYLLERTRPLFRLALALYIAERVLTFPGLSDRVADIVIAFSFWVQVGLWIMAALRFSMQRRIDESHDWRLAGVLNIVIFVAGLGVWTVVALLVLDNLGVNITALVAGLGVGGIAIALAVQAILGDLFASLSIALDRPFTVGDMLRIDDCEGRVEQIGIKSVRLRSVSGEQIILSNADVLKSRVRNYRRLEERRVMFTLRVRHDCSSAQLNEVPKLVSESVAAWGHARFVHCLLKTIGESALEFEVQFFIPVKHVTEMEMARDVVNRAVLEKFAAAGISLAYPTQTVNLVRA